MERLVGYLLLVGFLPAHTLWAEESIQIKMSGYDKPLSCTKDEKDQGYVCETEAQKPVIVLANPTNGGFISYTAISFSEKFPNILKTRLVEEIRNKDQVLFSAMSGYPGTMTFGGWSTVAGDIPKYDAASFIPPPPMNTEDSLLTAYGDYNLMTVFAATAYDVMPSPRPLKPGYYPAQIRLRGGEKFENTFALFRKNYTESRAKIAATLESTDFTIELDDGQKVPCTKGKNRTLNDAEKTHVAAFARTPACQIMKCGPVEWAGKVKELSLLVPYSAGVEELNAPVALIHSDNGGFEDIPKVMAVRHRDSQHPLLSFNSEYQKYYDNFAKKSAQAGYNPVFPIPSKNDLSFLTHPMTKMSIERLKNTCAPGEPIVSSFDKRYLSLREATADKELVQEISVSFLGITSSWKPADAKAPCDGESRIVDQSTSINPGNLRTLHEKENPKPISLEVAQALFDHAKQMKDIAWKYKRDGCYARAHLMARRFEAMGVDVGKVWIGGDLRVPEESIAWTMHVAPVVYVKGEQDKIERYVIDPSLAKKPVTVSEWSALMKKGVVGPDTYTSFPFPMNASTFERSAIAFSSSNPYLQYEQLNTTEKDKLAAAKSIMKQYKEAMP